MNASGLDTILWRSTYSWSALRVIAEAVLERWNTATTFIVSVDERERVWAVRHSSQQQPFLLLNEESLRGSVPRTGNPLPVLLLFGMALEEPGCMEVSFASGQTIDVAKFDIADLQTFLPQATHPAHRKLAELAMHTQD